MSPPVDKMDHTMTGDSQEGGVGVSPSRRPSTRQSFSKEMSDRHGSKMSVSSMDSTDADDTGDEQGFSRRRSSVGTSGTGRRRSSVGRRSSRRGSKPPSNEVKIERMVLPPEAFYGKLKRDPIKGVFRLHESRQEHMDFTFIDLFTRDTIVGTPEELALDPYIFKPKLMHCRSWVYQELHDHVESGREGMLIMSVSERLGTTMSHKCSDRLKTGGPGMWSPVMYLAPMMFIVAFTADFLLMILAFFALVNSIFCSKACNGFKTYKMMRPTTIMMRIILAVYVFGISDIGGYISNQEYLASIALMICMLLLLNDFVSGDIGFILGLESEICYSIERLLPGKILVCRRVTGGRSSLNKYESNNYNPLVVGEGKSGNEVVLIAETQGLLFELQPMDKVHEWHTVLGMVRRKRGFKLEFYGTATFNETTKHADCFDNYGVPKFNSLAGGTSQAAMMRACAEAERVADSRRLTESPSRATMARRSSAGGADSRTSLATFRKSIGLGEGRNLREELKEKNVEILIGLELMDRQINKIAQAEYAKQTREMKDEAGHHTEGTEGTKAQHLRRQEARGTNILAPNLKQHEEMLKAAEHADEVREEHQHGGFAQLLEGGLAEGQRLEELAVSSTFMTDSAKLDTLNRGARHEIDH